MQDLSTGKKEFCRDKHSAPLKSTFTVVPEDSERPETLRLPRLKEE